MMTKMMGQTKEVRRKNMKDNQNKKYSIKTSKILVDVVMDAMEHNQETMELKKQSWKVWKK